LSGQGGSLVYSVTQLCRGLRERGLQVGTSHSSDAIRALHSVGVHNRDQVYWALRCVLASSPEDFPIFDELFWQLFGTQAPATRNERGVAPRDKPKPPELEKPPKGPPAVTRFTEEQDRPDEGESPEEVPAASDFESQAKKDFSGFADEEIAEIERIAARIARRLAARPSRRWKAARRGARVDLRRTVRKSLSSGGEVATLSYRVRKPRKTRIVALCDVSGSMDLYSRFLLQFLYALQGSVARVESFVFATSLRRITEALHERPYSNALKGLGAQVSDWSGGTRIGACLAEFNREWPRLVDRRTVVVILSDGWDTGDPQELSDAMATLKLRSRRVVWLNPLLGSEGYEPLTQGMQAALPHLSVFAPAHNLESLRALERHLLT
jgi:uncharacterized protein with von Willebrand factor type A (vWA) domain